MARNNYGILTWRAPSEGVSPTPIKQRAATLAVPVASEKVDPPQVIQLHSKLKPREAQKAVLDSMFSGPILLRELLSKSPVKPRTAEDAALFLLQHHKELQPFLYAAHDRTKSVELLKHLILDWAVSVPELIELEFPGDCSISAANQIFLPIPRLGTLPVKDEDELAGHKRGRRYSPAFVLIHSPWGYITEIEFKSRGSRTPDSTSVRSTRPTVKSGNKRGVEPTQRLKFDQFLMMFDSAINAQLMKELRVSRRFVAPDFDALQGREILGGLPSLGKRR